MIIKDKDLDYADRVSISHLWKRIGDSIMRASTGTQVADRYAGLVEVRSLINGVLDELRKSILSEHRDDALEHHSKSEPGAEVTFQFKGQNYVVDLDVYVPNRVNWKAVAQHYASQPNYMVVVGRCTDSKPAVRINTAPIRK